MRLKNKKGEEISFSLLFAILAGAAILGLAIFISVKLIGTGDSRTSAELSNEIGILLNPLETSFESASSTSISFPAETRIINRCNLNGNFGTQLISIEQKRLGKWSETDFEAGFKNKYIFSKNSAEGKKFYIFSMPFSFPFKVSDLIYITPANQNYCFKNPPEEVLNDLAPTGLEDGTIQANFKINNCTEKDYIVCFDSAMNCNASVNYNSGYVRKDIEKLYFYGKPLMFAAIFSDKEVYECQLKRLMKRAKILSDIYLQKERVLTNKGCASAEKPQLEILSGSLKDENFQDSSDLHYLSFTVEQLIQSSNRGGACKLW